MVLGFRLGPNPILVISEEAISYIIGTVIQSPYTLAVTISGWVPYQKGKYMTRFGHAAIEASPMDLKTQAFAHFPTNL